MEHIHEDVKYSQLETDNPSPPPDVEAPTRLVGNPPCGSICEFSQQESHAELEKRSNSRKKLTMLIIFYLIAMSVEIIGGIKSNSLAVLTDAAHMFSDVASFSISLFAVWASGWKPTSRQSFGYHRLEVIAALLSVLIIWFISGILIYEALDRILHNGKIIDGKMMFLAAVFGFLINLVMIKWLGHDHSHHGCGSGTHHHDHDHDHDHHDHIVEDSEETVVSPQTKKTRSININLQGAYLHVLTDMIQSIGVMITGAVIWVKPNWVVIDLVCTTVFSIIGVISTLSMLANVLGILTERTPKEVDICRLKSSLKSIQGVFEVHDLHVWSITAGKIAMSCHVTVESGVSSKDILIVIRQLCRKTYQINHVTVQIEQE